MPQSLVQNLHHTIFSTKGRAKMIRGRWATELYSYIGGIMKRMNCRLISAGGTKDHMHLLTSLLQSSNRSRGDSVSWGSPEPSVGDHPRLLNAGLSARPMN